MARFDAVIVTCEHGGNEVPAPYRALFKGRKALLATHRGWDIGALPVAERFAKALRAPLVYATVTRLVVDLNRSDYHRNVFSELTRKLSHAERDVVFLRHYRPYRDKVEAWIATRVAKGERVLHVSVHSFTPKLHGEVRNCEIGLLYDPKRPGERHVADAMHAVLNEVDPGLRVRRNYPYLGTSDAFQTYLRRRFPAGKYVAMELEMNQGMIGAAKGRARVGDALLAALKAVR